MNTKAVLWEQARMGETLRVEESGHPEAVGSALPDPARELRVPLEKFREPETERRRRPRDLRPECGHARVEHVVECVAQVLRRRRIECAATVWLRHSCS